MPDTDLDEVDLCLLDPISYARRVGLSWGESERFLRACLEGAFEAADDYEDKINTGASMLAWPADAPYRPIRRKH